ncbi:MAG: polymorphic toxin type 50 domain-containing protein [Oscillospiraceae bacterium]|nr:polymorphic toxin type 50 domain-containing protein [Oscillospiraceae bacterium]
MLVSPTQLLNISPFAAITKRDELRDTGDRLPDANEKTQDFLRHERFSTTKRYLRNKKLEFIDKPKRKHKKHLTNTADSGIMDANEGKTDMLKEVTGTSFNEMAERQKILDGTYPNRIIQGRQNKHIEGTIEYNQKCLSMNKESPGSKPAILITDAQALIDKYKGTGHINITKGSEYPVEIVDTDIVIGKTWVKSLQKYVDTKRMKIIYSSKGVHIVPKNDYRG